MSYTPEFERWVEQVAGAITDADPIVHFWLSAFARVVREEETKRAINYFGMYKAYALHDAFNSLCTRFGLELEGK